MSWTWRIPAGIAVAALLLAGTGGCAAGEARGDGQGTASPSPAGRLLSGTDKEGRHYREVPEEGAPEVGIEVQPDAGDAWDVRLTVRHFRFSPAGTEARAVPGRGFAFLFVDDRLVTRLRGTAYRIEARFVPRGTHHVTARLYADDGTAWAVAGEPVQSTADITASDPGPGSATPSTPGTPSTPATSVTPSALSGLSGLRGRNVSTRLTGPTGLGGLSAAATELRTEGRGSPAPAGKAT